jgi:hypothetical protein
MTSSILTNSRARSQNVAPEPVSGSLSGERRLRLLPSGDGWSLVSEDGELVFSALGLSGRRQCLAFAQAEGVIALIR